MNQLFTNRDFTCEPDIAAICHEARAVAHDLNNQIMIVLNSLDRVLVLDPGDTDARLALKAAERCAALAAQLLPAPRLAAKATLR